MAVIFVISVSKARKSATGVFEALRSFGTSHRIEYCRESTERSFQEQILDSLRLGDRNRASNLLSEFGNESQALKSKDFSHIFQYCARTPDPLFVMETFQFMEERNIKLSSKCYFHIIRALCKGGYIKEAFNIVKLLGENSDVNPVLPMYNTLLDASVQTHNLSYAKECLDLMEQQTLGKNEITYGLLLKLAVLQQDLSSVYEIWKECSKNYTPSIISLRKFVWAFTKLRDLESAYAALQQMVSVAFQHNEFSITTTAEGKLFVSRLDIPMPYNSESTRTVYSKNCYKEEDSKSSEYQVNGLSLSEKSVPKPVLMVLRWSFGDIIHTCGSMRNTLLAEQLMLQMQTLGLEPSRNTYDGFIRALVHGKRSRDGIEVIKTMQQKNMKPHDSTLAVVSIGCSRELELDLAENFLDQISECSNAHPYNAFLEACDRLDRPERAVPKLAKMKRLNLLPDIRTYELLFSLFGNVNAPYEDGNILSQVDASKRIKAIEMDMVRHGIHHSPVSMRNLLKALGSEGMMQELIQYLRLAESRFSHRSTPIGIPVYNTVLHSLVEAKESHMAIEIFKSMISCGFRPDSATYNIMIDCCSVIECYKSAFALVSMMIRDGFYPHVVTYTALVKISLKSEDFGEALKLIDQAISEGIQPDVALYNTVLQKASEKGRVDVIEFIIEQMHQMKIQPDPSTCSHVFSAYVDNDFHSTAMEALQVLSLRMISENDEILEDLRLEHENLICDEDLESESNITKVFKDSANLGVALLYLRWCAISGVPISWLPNKSLWAKRISSDYASRFLG